MADKTDEKKDSKATSEPVKTEPVKPVKYVSVTAFLNEAKHLPQYQRLLTKVRLAGFTAYMRSLDKFYLANAKDFLPYLDKYLNIK